MQSISGVGLACLIPFTGHALKSNAPMADAGFDKGSPGGGTAAKTTAPSWAGLPHEGGACGPPSQIKIYSPIT